VERVILEGLNDGLFISLEKLFYLLYVNVNIIHT